MMNVKLVFKDLYNILKCLAIVAGGLTILFLTGLFVGRTFINEPPKEFLDFFVVIMTGGIFLWILGMLATIVFFIARAFYNRYRIKQ